MSQSNVIQRVPENSFGMTERDVAKFFGIAIETARGWRKRREGPPFAKIGGSVRYRPADVVAWAETQVVAR